MCLRVFVAIHPFPAMKKFSLVFILFCLFASCSIIGIHFKIHNPNRAGKYPKKTAARVLLGNQETKFRTCYDVKHYKLDVEFGQDLKKDKSITGIVVITSVALTDIDTVQLDLAESMRLSSCEVTELVPVKRPHVDVINIDPATFSRKENAVFVKMPHTIRKGNSFAIGIRFSGTPSEAKKAPWSGGFVRKEDDLKKPWWGVACQTEGASSWWPCKDVLNDEPDSVDVTLTVPAELKAISNGELISETSFPATNEMGRTAFHWHVSNPINLYNITFYIGNYKLLHDTYYSKVTHDTLQLNHYVLEQNYEKAKTHFQQTKKYIAFYEATFGPYAFYKDGFKLVESPYAGMEHQSGIAYGNGYKNDPRNGFDYIILHEAAHEWWGNAVTGNDLAEGWIHEGFATYSEALYVEKTKGYAAYENYLLNYRLFIINRRPLVGEKGIRYFNYKDGDIYMKGAWVLHSLRHVVANDSLFFDILHSFYMENRMKEISSESFIELVNRKTGKELNWFFNQYLHNRFTPELEYCIKDNTLYYRWNSDYTNTDFNKMQVGAFGILPESKDKRGGYSGATFEIGKLTPTFSVQAVAIQQECKPGFYNSQALFKASENKSLVKVYSRQIRVNF